MGKFHALIGYTYAPEKEYLIEEDTLANYPRIDVTNDEELEAKNDDLLLDEIYEGSLQGKIDLLLMLRNIEVLTPFISPKYVRLTLE